MFVLLSLQKTQMSKNIARTILGNAEQLSIFCSLLQLYFENVSL